MGEKKTLNNRVLIVNSEEKQTLREILIGFEKAWERLVDFNLDEIGYKDSGIYLNDPEDLFDLCEYRHLLSDLIKNDEEVYKVPWPLLEHVAKSVYISLKHHFDTPDNFISPIEIRHAKQKRVCQHGFILPKHSFEVNSLKLHINNIGSFKLNKPLTLKNPYKAVINVNTDKKYETWFIKFWNHNKHRKK